MQFPSASLQVTSSSWKGAIHESGTLIFKAGPNGRLVGCLLGSCLLAFQVHVSRSHKPERNGERALTYLPPPGHCREATNEAPSLSVEEAY